MAEEERLSRTLVQIPDPPLPDLYRMYVPRIDLLRKLDSDAYSPRVVSIWALCRRPLKSTYIVFHSVNSSKATVPASR
jgi:hypothetical protein